MAKIVCSACIRDEVERKTMMDWIRRTANGGYSELGDVVHLIYEEDDNDPENSNKKWDIIHTFEALPYHSIQTSKA